MGGEAPAKTVHGRLVSTEVWVIGMRKRAFGPEGAVRGRDLAALAPAPSVAVANVKSVSASEIHDEALLSSDLVSSIHQLIVLGIVVTVGYVVYAVLRRVLFLRRLKKYESILAENDHSDSSGFSGPDEDDSPTVPEEASESVFARQIEQARGERPL